MPPAPSENSTLLTMAFSSTTTPHATQMEAPDASCCSISVEPQLGQKVLFRDMVVFVVLLMFQQQHENDDRMIEYILYYIL